MQPQLFLVRILNQYCSRGFTTGPLFFNKDWLARVWHIISLIVRLSACQHVRFHIVTVKVRLPERFSLNGRGICNELIWMRQVYSRSRAWYEAAAAVQETPYQFYYANSQYILRPCSAVHMHPGPTH